MATIEVLLYSLTLLALANMFVCMSAASSQERDIQKRLYRQLYLSIYNDLNKEGNIDTTSDLIIRRTGHILNLPQFEVPQMYKDIEVVRVSPYSTTAGNVSTAATTIVRAVLPPWVIQAMFDVSDLIPNMTHWIANPEDGNVRFSNSYSEVINRLLDHIRKQNVNKLRNVYDYLKEHLTDPHTVRGSSLTRKNNTARLTLYHRYKTNYYQAKLSIETEINYNRKEMSRKRFKWWYGENHEKLLHKVKDKLKKWYDFGQKAEVEDWIANTHSFHEVHNIETAKKLLRAYKQPSWDQYTNIDWGKAKEEAFIYRVRFLPMDWFEYIKLKYSESKEQIKYRIRENEKMIKELRKLKEKALESTRTPEYLKAYKEMKKRYIRQKTKLIQNVMKRKYNTQMCRYTTKKKYCRAVTRLRPIIEKLQSRHAAIHWQYQRLRSPLPKHGAHIVKSIDKAINISINMSIALKEELLRENSTWIPHYDISYPNDTGLKFIKFNFNSQVFQQKLKHFNDFKLPKRLLESRLWYLNRDRTNNRKVNQTISKYLRTVEGYLNSIASNITVNVTLLKVDIERKWFNQTLFRTLMKFSQAEFLVSPGPQSSPSQFRKVVSSSQYLLPAFPSSLLIATDVQISLPYPLPKEVKEDLLSLSYEPRVSGGYGPFSFGYMFGDKTKTKKQFKLQIEKFKNSFVLSIPGSQLIGYICHVVTKFPT